MISEANITISNKPQSAKLRLPDLSIEFRLEFIPSEMKGEACVLRLFPLQGYFDKRLEDLNYEPEEVYILRKHAKSRKGLIIFNGETSSGKSTAIRSMILEANPETSNVWAVEDPVEVVMRGVNHIQVREGVVSWSQAIRSFMRVNPKIIFVGEVRDADTAKAVIDAVSTGHMVFTTLHTKDNPSAILRFIALLQEKIDNIDFISSLLADTLMLSVNQRLVIGKDGKIKPIVSIFEPTPEDRKLLEKNRIIDLKRRLFERGDIIGRKVYGFVKRDIITPDKFVEVLSVEERNEFKDWLKTVLVGDVPNPYQGKKAEKFKQRIPQIFKEVENWEEDYYQKG